MVKFSGCPSIVLSAVRSAAHAGRGHLSMTHSGVGEAGLGMA